MATSNAILAGIDETNAKTLARIAEFRRALVAGEASATEIPVLKQQHPYRGLVPIEAAGQDFVMFHAHDDVIVWEYLWRGADGYENKMVRKWCEWCRTAEGEIWDIGAYTGLMSILAGLSNSQNRVHLFEPLERITERASINIKLNGLHTRVACHPVACSDRNDTANIILYRDGNFLGTGSSIEEKGDLKQFGTRAIKTISLDTFFPDAFPKVVKIDVEGHELAALMGMRKTLARAKPHMLLEVWDRTRTEVEAFMSDLGYRMERVEDRDLAINNFFASPVA